MRVLVCLNHNHFKLYDNFMMAMPELKRDAFNWHELLTQIFITLSTHAADFLKNTSQLPMIDRMAIDDRMHEPDFFYRLHTATQELCYGVFLLCWELGMFKNGVFDYTILNSKDSLVYLVSNQTG